MSKTVSPLQDPELVEMLGRDPELLAIADALVSTVGAEARPRNRRAVALVGLPAIAIAAAIAVAVLLWPFSSSSSVLDNALAALGKRPVTHVVLQDSLGSYRLDLRTGARTFVSGREEIWYRAGQGIYSRRTFPGAPARAVFVPARLLAPDQGATVAAIFASSYRQELRARGFHVVGSGKLGTTAVYWLQDTPRVLGSPSRTEVQQVAISKATFKPVYARRLLNGHLERGSGIRVLSIDSTDRAPVDLRRNAPNFGNCSSNGFCYGFPVGYPALSIRRARAMYPQLLIHRRIADLPLVLVAETPVASPTVEESRYPGAAFYYGSLLDTGLPNDREPDHTGLKPYLSVAEYTRPNTYTKSQVFPPEGSALIDGSNPFPSTPTATLRMHGLYIVIQGSSDALVRAAAERIGR